LRKDSGILFDIDENEEKIAKNVLILQKALKDGKIVKKADKNKKNKKTNNNSSSSS
jgi:hypothetical protein